MKLVNTRLFCRSTALAALSAAFLLLAPAPTQAQVGLVGTGHGTYLAANGQDTLTFTFFVAEGPGGSAHGYAIWSGPNSVVLWRATSFMFFEGALGFAGPIVATIGTPPPGYVIGVTAFTGFRDNGFHAVDETLSLSVVPPQFGHPTIQQILALLGPPPPGAWRPLVTGGVWTR